MGNNGNNGHNGNIRVLVADSEPIFSYGLCQALSNSERIEVIDQALSGQEVIDKTNKFKPDIIVIGLNLSGYNGIQITEIIGQIYPEIKIIILSPPDAIEDSIEHAIGVGAKGFLSKNISPVELAKSVIETADIGAVICPTMIPFLMNKIAEKHEEKPLVELILSTRERQVMELVAEGMGNREIAKTLFISANTVKGHLRRIIDKLKVNNRVEVARYVLLNGLPDPILSEDELIDIPLS